MIQTVGVAATTVSQQLCAIPAGEGEITIANSGASAGAVTVTAAGSTTGVPIAPGDSIFFRTFPNQPATTMSVVAASTASVGVVISSYNPH